MARVRRLPSVAAGHLPGLCTAILIDYLTRCHSVRLGIRDFLAAPAMLQLTYRSAEQRRRQFDEQFPRASVESLSSRPSDECPLLSVVIGHKADLLVDRV